MTDCPNATIRDRLPDLVHGTLDAGVRADVEMHLAACADCMSELALLRAARATLTRGREVDVARIVAALPRPAATGPRLLEFPSPAARSRPSVRRLPPRWGAVAAAAILVLTVGAGSLMVRDDRPGDATAPALADARASATAAAAPGASEAQPSTAAPLLVVNTGALTDADLAGLLDELDELEAVPAAEPVSLAPAELPGDVGAGAEL